MIFVSRSGLVQNKVIETETPISQHELEQITNYLNQTLTGLSIQEIKAKTVRDMAEEKATYDKLLRRALELSQEALCR